MPFNEKAEKELSPGSKSTTTVSEPALIIPQNMVTTKYYYFFLDKNSSYTYTLFIGGRKWSKVEERCQVFLENIINLLIPRED